MMWLAVNHTQKEALEIFAREIAPGGTGMCECIMEISEIGTCYLHLHSTRVYSFSGRETQSVSNMY